MANTLTNNFTHFSVASSLNFNSINFSSPLCCYTLSSLSFLLLHVSSLIIAIVVFFPLQSLVHWTSILSSSTQILVLIHLFKNHCFTCTLHSLLPPGRSAHQTPGVCGSQAATAVSMTAADCGGKRWDNAGYGWLHPLLLQWCFPLWGTSLWWGDCCLLVVTTDQLVRPVAHKHKPSSLLRETRCKSKCENNNQDIA